MRKSIVKKVSAICLALTLALGMTACGGDSKSTTEAGTSAATEAATTAEVTTEAAATGSFTGDKYVDNGTEFSIKASDLPANYKLVPYEKIKEGFKAILDNKAVTYDEIAAAFGDDGIRMDGIVYEGYAYYAWYADKDYGSDGKVQVLLTLKKDGDKLTYYAYSSVGIDSTDVQ